MKKGRILGRLLDIVLVLLMVLCVYGIICRINRQPDQSGGLSAVCHSVGQHGTGAS